MFKRKPPALPAQLEWKHADEPVLMSWTIKARSYNTTVANTLFVVMSLITIFIFTWSFLGDGPNVTSFIPASTFMSMSLFGIYTMTHQTKNFAYRFTRLGFEVCEWKDYPKSVLIATYVLTAVVVVVLLAMLFYMPSSLGLAFTGAGGMMLMALFTLWSKDYQKLHTEFHHIDFERGSICGIVADKRKKLVGLKHEWFNKQTQKQRISIEPIFAPKTRYEELLAFFQSQLPADIPCTEENIELLG